jgi:DNA-binding transcriptional LysR family regulator
VAILPLTVAEEPGQPVQVVRLVPEPTWSATLAWPAGRRQSPAVAAFLDFVFCHGELALIGADTGAS